MIRDAGFPGTPAILNDGLTISLRGRTAARANSPLNGINREGGPSVIPPPEDGIGYRIRN
jgi:hypothetical protein